MRSEQKLMDGAGDQKRKLVHLKSESEGMLQTSSTASVIVYVPQMTLGLIWMLDLVTSTVLRWINFYYVFITSM